MNADTWFALPTPQWAGSLVGLALGLVAATGGVYTSVGSGWLAQLGTAMVGTKDRDGVVWGVGTGERVKARAALAEVLRRDPSAGLGRVALALVGMMAALGIVGGTQIPNVGWLYTVVPVAVATVVAATAILVPGRRERRAAKERLKEMIERVR